MPFRCIRFFLLSLALLGPLVGWRVAEAAGDVALPSWPQQFEVPQGMTRTYAFPITQAGNVTVNLTWSGAPMTVALVDIDGKAISTMTDRAAPNATLTFAVSEANVSKSNVLAIALTVAAQKPPEVVTPPAGARATKAAKPPPLTVAKGNISLTAPALNHGTLQPKLKALVAQRQAKLGTAPSPGPSAIERLAARNAEGVTAIETQRRTLQTQFAGKVAARAQTLQTQTQSIQTTASRTALLSNVKLAAVKLPKVTVVSAGTTYTKPTVLGGTADTASPAAKTSAANGGTGGGTSSASVTGFPGDEIVLRVGGIDPNANNTVLFTVHTTGANGGTATMNVPGIVYAAAVNGDAFDLTVGVPYAGETRDSAASIVVTAPSGSASAPFAFVYNPIPLPKISSVVPASNAVPGKSLVVLGTGFGTGSKVFFRQLPGADAPTAGSSSFNNDKQVTVSIPNYTAEAQFVSPAYVSYHYKNKHFEADLVGADYPVTLDATSVAITSTDRTTGTPGSAVLLGGNGMASMGTVHCNLGPGKDLTAKTLSWSDTAVLFEIPDYSGITQAVNGTIYVLRPDGKKSNLLGFAFAPQYVHQYVDLSKYLTGQWVFHPGSPDDKWEIQDGGTKLWVHHRTDFWNGSSGTDIAFWWSDYWPLVGPMGQPMAMYLKNGWTVSSIDWSQFPVNDPIFSTAGYTAHAGTTNPAVYMNWWLRIFVMSDNSMDYSVRIDIYGPKGTDYF
jgi:hypothetical protein